MKKIIIFALAALMSLSLLSCDIPNIPRPYSGTVKIKLEQVPEAVKAVSIWCTANGWKADNVNGSSEYIAKVETDADTGMRFCMFTLSDYVFSEPLQFQLTPMPAEDTKMSDDWWSYAISGSSSYSKDKNNMYCDFNAKGGHDGSMIIISPATYGTKYWEKKSFPIYGVSKTRWFNENYKDCYTLKN